MALSTARIHRVRGRPPLLAAGITSLIHSHSSSVRSLGYIFSFIYPFYTTREDFSDRLLGRASPIKRDMLTGLAGPVPLESISIHFVGRGLAPGCHLSRSHFGPRGVQELDARPRRRGGTRQRLGSRDHLAGDLGAPVSEVMGH